MRHPDAHRWRAISGRHPAGRGSRLVRAVPLALFLVQLAALPASATPTVQFVATGVQGSVCVAPCAVHFDAIGNGNNLTTDGAYSREFHSLAFHWNFGDPGAGAWTHSGHDKNRAEGAIAGHLYEKPGSYTVTLVVTNNAGESGQTQQTVTVTDPQAHFASPNVHCFANSASPDWTGCPAGAVQHANASDYDAAMSSNSLCNADAGKRWCLFKRGDTFDANLEFNLSNATGPGLVSAFGTGSPPVLRDVSTSGWLTLAPLNSGWTFSGLDALGLGPVEGSRGTELATLTAFSRGSTLHDIIATGLGGTCVWQQGGGSGNDAADLVAVIDVSCTNSPPNGGQGGGFFGRVERMIMMGWYQDSNGAGEFNMRTAGLHHSVIQHSWMQKPCPDCGGPRNNLQIRGTPAFNNAPVDSEFNIVSDNVFLMEPSSIAGIRVCQHGACWDDEGGTHAPIEPEMQDLIIERNFFRFERNFTTAGTNPDSVFVIQGGDITIRNNIVDYSGAPTAHDNLYFVRNEGPSTACSISCPTNSDRLFVYNNTFYSGDTRNMGSVNLCSSSDGASGSGHQCSNNILHANGYDVFFSMNEFSTPQWTGGNNRTVCDGGVRCDAAEAEPFDGALPAIAATVPGSFRISTSNPNYHDAGANVAANSAFGVHLDAGLNCRPVDGADANAVADWDLGAFEAGALAGCPSAVPAAPLLLPQP